MAGELYGVDAPTMARIANAVRAWERQPTRVQRHRRRKIMIDGGGCDPIRCRASNTSVQSLAGATTDNVLAFPEESQDTDAQHDTAVNNDRITINTAGSYIVFASVTVTVAGTVTTATTIRLKLRLNGATIVRNLRSGLIAGCSGGSIEMDLWYETTFSAADYLQVLVDAEDAQTYSVTLAYFNAESCQ